MEHIYETAVEDTELNDTGYESFNRTLPELADDNDSSNLSKSNTSLYDNNAISIFEENQTTDQTISEAECIEQTKIQAIDETDAFVSKTENSSLNGAVPTISGATSCDILEDCQSLSSTVTSCYTTGDELDDRPLERGIDRLTGKKTHLINLQIYLLFDKYSFLIYAIN